MEISTTAQTVGSTVRAEMARRRVTQAQVAQILGKSQQAVSARLAGQVAFDVEELTAVAYLLQIDVASLLAAVA